MALNQLTDSEIDVSLSAAEDELSRGDVAAARRCDQTPWDKQDLNHSGTITAGTGSHPEINLQIKNLCRKRWIFDFHFDNIDCS